MADERSPVRPVLWGTVHSPTQFKPRGGGNSTVDPLSPQRQGQRLKSRLREIDQAFKQQVELATSLGASDPQLVIVFEGIDKQIDLAQIAKKTDLEVLSEVERDYDPDSDFPRKTRDKESPVSGYLHAVCINEESRKNILKQWNLWQKKGIVDKGYAQLRDLFAHLKDARPWGPRDRIRMSQSREALDGMLPGDHSIEIELWYRQSEPLRQKAEHEVTRLVETEGGRVIFSAQIAEVGYHGMKCVVPLELLQRLATDDVADVSVVQSSHVMYLRKAAQSDGFSDAVPCGSAADTTDDLPVGDPVLCVLDGVPVANHPRLAGRVVVWDPDGLDSSVAVVDRRHGTAMASVCVWGDLSTGGSPARRPVLVRPILTPTSETQDREEELPEKELAPDLMRKVFRELFAKDTDRGPVGESIVVVNLSVADPSSPFDGIVSSWARTLDWLSAEYGVLVVVAAGNHGSLQVPGGTTAFCSLNGSARANSVNSAVAETSPRRSLLSPAESLNALTVGALNMDDSGSFPLGYRVDPSDGVLIVNPTSAIGPGQRRSVKPDLLAPGGRVLFHKPMMDDVEFISANHKVGPGIRVAAPNDGNEAFTMGTSPAAAAISREAARVVDVVAAAADRELTRSELAVASKALVAHSARIPDKLHVDDRLGPYAHGYGALSRSLADGCAEHEAIILYVGNLGASEQSILSFPLPGGLQQRGVKRVTATLAWLSPVNWRHRQYRCAKLEFAKPTGFHKLGATLSIDATRSKRGTLQHAVWEVDHAIATKDDSSLDLTVRCTEQAGGLHDKRVDFAVALSLWVEPSLNVDVYHQVQQKLVAPVPIITE